MVGRQMPTSVHPVTAFRMQTPYVAGALIAIMVVAALVSGQGMKSAALFFIGIGIGLTLYHAAFGFTTAYRQAIRDKDLTGVAAQFVMLVLAMLMFAPVLAEGEAFGQRVGGAVAPVGVSMAFGAFIFGLGMQLAGGCGSGTLYTAGGGNVRMVLVLFSFCIGGFWGSLDLGAWQRLPGIGSVSLGERLGWPQAIAMQIAVMAFVFWGLRRLGGRVQRPLGWHGEFTWGRLIRGPWPLLLSAGLLALFNWLTLLIAGHPWSITWAFALWTAKAAMAFGWDPHTSAFWTGGFQKRALRGPLLADVTSVMNFGIMLGAFLAAALAGRIAPVVRIGLRPALAAILGGLLLGYGARLAYGCNIGAFFSGIASTSLHAWVWIICAVIGNWSAIRLRPLFHLAD